MMFWIREVAGWLLVALGLFAFKVAYFDLIRDGMIVHSVPVVFMGFVLYRGGIHLIKVAVAIHISREARREVRGGRAPLMQPRYTPDRKPVIPGAPRPAAAKGQA